MSSSVNERSRLTHNSATGKRYSRHVANHLPACCVVVSCCDDDGGPSSPLCQIDFPFPRAEVALRVSLSLNPLPLFPSVCNAKISLSEVGEHANRKARRRRLALPPRSFVSRNRLLRDATKLNSQLARFAIEAPFSPRCLSEIFPRYI